MTKRHVYKYEVVLPDVNVASIHHMIAYECNERVYNGTPAFRPGDSQGKGPCQIITIE